MVYCNCADCLKGFYAEGADAYTDTHALDHHPRCNHITQKNFSVISDYIEVDYYGTVEKVILWEGYRCTCEEEYEKDES